MAPNINTFLKQNKRYFQFLHCFLRQFSNKLECNLFL